MTHDRKWPVTLQPPFQPVPPPYPQWARRAAVPGPGCFPWHNRTVGRRYVNPLGPSNL